ncbi:hypothetical protein AOQ84DRAFT_380925 [Glonium stellatum]|uniref:Uncharacterized protein n=1 Tax=Glonium stellatum TaxID=574774 RepID=A0A8E2JNX4_9PEZI|nr:hypothetical protein AOQ84DRAFT_380925 [Glonium stellatum]
MASAGLEMLRSLLLIKRFIRRPKHTYRRSPKALATAASRIHLQNITKIDHELAKSASIDQLQKAQAVGHRQSISHSVTASLNPKTDQRDGNQTQAQNNRSARLRRSSSAHQTGSAYPTRCHNLGQVYNRDKAAFTQFQSHHHQCPLKTIEVICNGGGITTSPREARPGEVTRIGMVIYLLSNAKSG